jgi:polyhydroxyalkanoate synthase subunit PhaC
MVAENQMVHPGAMTVLGTPVDLSRIACNTYVAAGLTDDITPWQTCYRTAQLVSGHSEFVLCSSGHIQTVVADPKHPRLGYFVNPATPPKAEDWLVAAQRHEGSWWEHWVGWPAEHSGGHSEAPQALGSSHFPPKEPAPGTYILQECRRARHRRAAIGRRKRLPRLTTRHWQALCRLHTGNEQLSDRYPICSSGFHPASTCPSGT